MGLGRGLVKRVFCKSKSSSIGARDGNERHFVVDKSRWTSVRLYLCGDELNSLLVENSSASIRSSEATVMQPLQDDLGDEESCDGAKLDECEELSTKEKENPPTTFSQEGAATLIQSTFRGYMARRRYEDIRKSGKGDCSGVEDPSVVNEAASTEVLVDDSVENFSIRGENGAMQHRVLHKSQSQVYRLKEEWDDSTLSSDTLRLRIQNRLEASTRRERALAYAFSQQLRACATKKKATWSDSNAEPNAGWSWLERWMATRVPENSVVEDCWSKHLEPVTTDRRMPMIASKRLDISFEGKESCGSNDVSVSFEEAVFPSQAPIDGYGQVKNKFKAAKNVSRRKTMPEYHRPVGSTKVNRRVSTKEAEEKKQKQVQARNTREAESKYAS